MVSTLETLPLNVAPRHRDHQPFPPQAEEERSKLTDNEPGKARGNDPRPALTQAQWRNQWLRLKPRIPQTRHHITTVSLPRCGLNRPQKSPTKGGHTRR